MTRLPCISCCMRFTLPNAPSLNTMKVAPMRWRTASAEESKLCNAVASATATVTATAAPPPLSDAAAAELALRHFGISGRLKRLTSERDVNLHLITPTQGYVLKLANPAEAAEVTDFQTKALLHLEGRDLPVPRVMRTLDGATEVATPDGVLRLLTYLEGRPLHLVQASAALRRSMAAMIRPVMPWSASASRKAARIASMATG